MVTLTPKTYGFHYIAGLKRKAESAFGQEVSTETPEETRDEIPEEVSVGTFLAVKRAQQQLITPPTYTQVWGSI